MKKIWIVAFLFYSLKSFAQTPEQLFDMTNKELVGDSVQTTFNGTPAILIEKPKREIPQVNEAEKVPQLNLKNIPTKDIKITTPFGHSREAAFLDQTTDFVSFVQILDAETILVEEQIQFIRTESDTNFVRVFENILQDKNKNKRSLEIQVTQVKRDGKNISVEEETTGQGIMIKDPTVLPIGKHNYIVTYLVRGAMEKNKAVSDLLLPITGTSWPLITERFTTVLMFPKKTAIYANELLFGTNNQESAQSTQIQMDGKGSIIFQTTRPLPAFADARIHVLFDASILIGEEKTLDSTSIIGICFIGVLVLYMGLSILSLRLRKEKKVLLKTKKINPILWCQEIGRLVTKEKQEKSDQLLKQVKQTLFLKDSSIGIVKILSFFMFNKGIVLEVTLLLVAMHAGLCYWDVIIPFPLNLFFIILSVITIYVIDHFGTKVALIKLAQNLEDILTKTPQGINLASRDIPTYLLKAIYLGFDTEWIKKLKSNNPSYHQLDFGEK